jgi:hypothetical protein
VFHDFFLLRRTALPFTLEFGSDDCNDENSGISKEFAARKLSHYFGGLK